MGKSSQVAMDPDSSSDRITARVGSRTKKAKIVFDPSDHHVPRKRNRRGENDTAVTTTGPSKSETSRTTTPLSSSPTEGGSSYDSHTSAATSTLPIITASHRSGTTTPGTSCRLCQKCGQKGPGRIPRKPPTTPWTCSACLLPKTDSKTSGNKQVKSKNQTKSVRHRTSEESDNINDGEEENEEQGEEEEEEEKEEDNKQQHDFAGFSETELGGHGNANDVTAEERLYPPVKQDPSADSDGGDLADTTAPSKSTKSTFKVDHNNDEGRDESVKDIRYWTCDDVCRFFGRHCQAWGDLFHEQEIDGASLLLMRKGDVLTRFGLKLGPAMELYQRIVALQNGDRDIVDVRLTWI
ncbi:sterile alpha motif domain-containing protein 1 [Anopheles marshallii]|uniref:sterile alpha motif domain-containing protein 1 n=1 Tax=Anopheles marshallii TaxID=1521116 RepID=UPI00237BE9A1|nr:sterile alpha motif domain-containing protein 1 [Anopheles marshallii]